MKHLLDIGQTLICFIQFAFVGGMLHHMHADGGSFRGGAPPLGGLLASQAG